MFATVSSYAVIRNKEFIRRATLVTFADGMTVRFLSKLTDQDAREQALVIRADMIARADENA